jgi:hypothetical protein
MECKFCNKCQKDLELIEFRQCKYPSGKSYYHSICKKCVSKTNVERIKKNGKKMTSEQKLHFAEYKKQWKIINKDKLNKNYRDKIANDINFRLRKNVSRAINHALKRMFSKKSNSIMTFLPYSIADLKSHLENQFANNMSWQNYGSYWQIDHIIPQSCLPYIDMSDENFKKCWSLENLRPLEAKLNMMDGSTRIRHKMYKNLVNGEI